MASYLQMSFPGVCKADLPSASTAMQYFGVAFCLANQTVSVILLLDFYKSMCEEERDIKCTSLQGSKKPVVVSYSIVFFCFFFYF